jgi:hypothetical protein
MPASPFSPAGRRSRQGDEGVAQASPVADAPSSDPSGHLLPAGEKGNGGVALYMP